MFDVPNVNFVNLLRLISHGVAILSQYVMMPSHEVMMLSHEVMMLSHRVPRPCEIWMFVTKKYSGGQVNTWSLMTMLT